jgi:hypothetical protein
MAVNLSALRAGCSYLQQGSWYSFLLSRVAVRARQTLSFVYALIIVFVSSIEARLLIDAAKETPERHKTVSTERARHTEIPSPRDKEPLRFGSTCAKFARGNVRSA